ncbi:hypothetical protein [Massilia sp. SYSU DXS3249]
MKNLSKETASSVAEIVGRKDDPVEEVPLLGKIPTCLFVASLLFYLLVSEGIRNYLSFLLAAAKRLMG